MEPIRTKTFLDQCLFKNLMDGLKSREGEFLDYVGDIKSSGFTASMDFIKRYGNDTMALRKMMNEKMQDELSELGGFMADGNQVETIKMKYLNNCRKLVKAVPKLLGLVTNTCQVFGADENGNIVIDWQGTVENLKKIASYKVDMVKLTEWYNMLHKLYEMQQQVNEFERKHDLPFLAMLTDSVSFPSESGIGLNFQNLKQIEEGGHLNSLEKFAEVASLYFCLDAKRRTKAFHGDMADTLKRTWQNFGWLNND